MNQDSKLSGCPAAGKAVWNAFNGWRKRYWKFRVCMLLLLFSGAFYEFPTTNCFIKNLVWYACQAIRNTTEPKLQWQAARTYRFEQIQQWQNALRRQLPPDWLDPQTASLLKLRVGQVNLDQLIAAARHYRVCPPYVTADSIRQNALTLGLASSAAIFDRPYQEIHHQIFDRDWSHYWTWENWQDAINWWFLYEIKLAVLPEPIFAALIPLLVGCGTLAGYLWRRRMKLPALKKFTIVVAFLLLYAGYAEITFYDYSWIWTFPLEPCKMQWWQILHLSAYFAVLWLSGLALARRLRNGPAAKV